MVETSFLVTGSAGLVGSQIVRDLILERNQVYAGYHQQVPDEGIPIHIDLNNLESIRKKIQQIKPDFVIHLASITNVDLCEKNSNLAYKINANATKILSKEAKRNNSFFVFTSTDYVFDGLNGLKKEMDKTNPIGVYGKSKLDGEKGVKEQKSDWCIIRTSTPFGMHKIKKSFPVWVAENLKEEKEINVLTDQFTSPTYVPNLSKMIIEVAKKRIQGIIHLAGSSRVSRYTVAEMVADKLGFEKKLIRPITLDKIKWIAKRPKDSSLDITKANSILDEKPMSLEDSLDDFLPKLKSSL